jgi:hypothetical protein
VRIFIGPLLVLKRNIFDSLWVAFLAMVLMGFTDAANNTQLFATLGIFQPNKLEASYACNYC